MAELTQGRDLSNRRPAILFTERFNVDTSVARTIYRGQPVILDKSVDTVNIVGWVAAVTLVTAVDVFVGIANENISVSAGDLEVTKEIDVITDGEVGFQSASLPTPMSAKPLSLPIAEPWLSVSDRRPNAPRARLHASQTATSMFN